MKTKDELNALKEEVKDLNKKLSELSEDELSQVSGGDVFFLYGQPGIEVPLLPGYLP